MEECNCKNILNLQPQCPVVLNISEGAGSNAGTLYHDELLNRDLSNQHPISAITDLQNSLDTLQTNINNEASARETADDTLDTKIDNLEIALEGDIQAEETAREQADTRLEGLISAEETRAKAAEESLSDDISAENTRAINAEETLQDNIDAEETRAKDAEQGLSDDISSEAGTRASEITRVEGLITDEETARISADNTLQGNINAEKTARENADSALQGNIDAEELARQNADSALQSNIDAEALARGNADTALNTKIDNHIADKANPHQVTKAQVGLGNVDNTADIDKPISTAVSAAFDAVEAEITNINDLIPNEASSSNQLADKAFVNSSISTNTANFIGTFNSVAELEAYSGTVTNNDYAFVVGTDSAGNTVYDRYKYTDATTPSSWVFEYELNNSSFTAAQWNAINSGATSTLVGQITTNQGNITTIQTTMSGYGNIVTHNVSEFATAAQGTKADTAVQPADLATVATSGSYNDLNDKPTIGNATLTIQKNGTAVDTFTANATADKAINIAVPTDTSDLTNGAGYITGITSSDVTTALGYTPYNSSNPSGYQTASDVATAIAGKQDTLVSGTNIKTINNNSILGSGNLNIDGLPSQAGQSGKYLTTDGTNPSWTTVSVTVDQVYDSTSANAQSGVAIKGAKFIQNTATGTNALTVGGTASSATSAVNIGLASTAGGGYSTAVGYYAAANGARCTSVGYGARIGGSTSDAIQIGNGNNSTAKSLSIGFYNTGNYQLLDGTTGLIPYQRINAITDSNLGGQLKTWTGTKAQYDAIVTKDPNTLYNITDDTDVSLTILEALYPVGSVYITTANTCPLSALISGSTWTQETCRQLVEKKEPTDNDPSWYNLYSDGWCDQGGFLSLTTADVNTPIDFIKTFADTNYTIVTTLRNNNTNAGFVNVDNTSGMTTSGTYVRIVHKSYSGCSPLGVFWQACGYTSTTTSHKQFRRTA